MYEKNTIWTTRTEYIDSETGEILKPSYARKHYIILKTKKDYERISNIECAEFEVAYEL